MAHHLTKEDRDRIAQLHHEGFSQVEIAERLERSPATISRELRRNATRGVYLAASADDQAKQRRVERPLERCMDREELETFVRRGLSSYWSPEQIAGRLKQQFPNDPDWHLSSETIYRWIEDQPTEVREYWRSHLRQRGKRKQRSRKNTALRDPAAKIANRPAVVEARERIGDFEGDTVLGPPGTGGLTTLVDRKSRFTIVTKIQSKEAQKVHRKIRDRLKILDEQQRHSITFDNGSEFARCTLLEDHLGITLYYADPGCPFQRGTNENTNGLIRQFFPKGTDFRDVTHDEVRDVEILLNNRPRACLGYQTPNEVFSANSTDSNCI